MGQITKNKKIQEEFEQSLRVIENDWYFNLERQLLDVREKLSEQMEKKNMSRADLAKSLNCSRSYVTQLLSGNENIRLSTLFKVSFALGIRPKIQLDDQEEESLRSIRWTSVRRIHLGSFGKSGSVLMKSTSAKGEYELSETE